MLSAWGDEEEARLQGLSLLAKDLYLRGLRRHMDLRTRIVGRARKVSYRQLAEVAEALPPPRSKDKHWQPSTKAIRHALGQLERAGLLVRLESEGRFDGLAFFLPCADDAGIRLEYEGQGTGAGRGARENAATAGPAEGRGAGRGARDRGRHLEEETKKYTTARAGAREGGEKFTPPCEAFTAPPAWGPLREAMGKRWHMNQLCSAKCIEMLIAWQKAGVTPEQVAAAIILTDEQMKGEDYAPTYLRGRVLDSLKPPSQKSAGWRSRWTGYAEKDYRAGATPPDEALRLMGLHDEH